MQNTAHAKTFKMQLFFCKAQSLYKCLEQEIKIQRILFNCRKTGIN